MTLREKMLISVTVLCLLSVRLSNVFGADRSLQGNPQLAAYFEAEVAQIEERNDLTNVRSAAEWTQLQSQLREQLFGMLGLSPRPEKTSLEAVTTGVIEHPEFTVEKICFQSLPGLYVTGNVYVPRAPEGSAVPSRMPTVLYVCGHGQVKKDGVSYGNKTHYQHHGAWFARNGYVCLTIDSLQLGEIEGIHHGTSRYGRQWWNARGYTPAGVEAWNCIRSLDYLQSRNDVDATRMGVTGRSGGGAYSWWIAALDERIQCAVPVAGITSLRDHVIHGCVEGHCDCMYHINTERWDFATIAALVAPRPLLISNTDRDGIFPLEGVVHIHQQVRHIYQLLGSESHLGLQITAGTHEDTQELQIHAFRWFNRFLKNDQSPIEQHAAKFFQPEQLKVLQQLPEDQINDHVDDIFVPVAAAQNPETILADPNGWAQKRLKTLREQCFRAWPDGGADWTAAADKPPVKVLNLDENGFDSDQVALHPAECDAPTAEGWQQLRIHFESQTHVPLILDVLLPADQSIADVTTGSLHVTEVPRDTICRRLKTPPTSATAVFIFSPRGVAHHRWSGDDSKHSQILRRFQLIGTTADTMRVWDVRRAIATVYHVSPKLRGSLKIAGDGPGQQWGLLAALFESDSLLIDVREIPADPVQWPSVLNLTRTITPEELVSLVAWKHHLQPERTGGSVLQLTQTLVKDSRWNGRTQ